MRLNFIVATLLATSVCVRGDLEVYPGDICIWDADNGVKKGCAAFWEYMYGGGCDGEFCEPYYGETVKVCKLPSASDYDIAFEVVVRHDNNGRLIYLEDGTLAQFGDWWTIKTVGIEVCSGLHCTNRSERFWRYFSYGNKVPGNFGTGNINGRSYSAGSTYMFDVSTTYEYYGEPEWGSWTTGDTLSFELLDECDGTEHLVLD